MWASIAKWVVTAIIMPMVHKMIDAWLKSREKARKLGNKIKKNKATTEAYEADSSDDNFSNLP